MDDLPLGGNRGLMRCNMLDASWRLPAASSLHLDGGDLSSWIAKFIQKPIGKADQRAAQGKGDRSLIAPLSPCASGSNAQVPNCGPGHENDPGCGANLATYGFWAVWLAGLGGVIAGIVSTGGTPATGNPASP